MMKNAVVVIRASIVCQNLTVAKLMIRYDMSKYFSLNGDKHHRFRD